MPQGAFQDKGKSHVRITVFAILAVHVVLLGVLLIAGCNRKTELADGSTPPGQPSDPLAPPPSPAATPDAGTPVPLPTPVPPPAFAGTPTTPDTNPPSVPVPGAPSSPVTPPGGALPPPTELTPPPPVPGPGVTDAGAGSEHTIAKGETLATIGKKYGVGYKAIEAANPGINPTRLKIGDKIKIPAASAKAAPAAPTASAGSGASSSTVYVVRSGDNLLKIAKATGVPVKQLRAANNLRTDQIRVGQKLKVPARHGSAPAEATAPPPVAPPVTLPTGQ